MMRVIISSFVVFILSVTTAYSQTTTFNCTGGVQNYTVPPCVTQLTVTVSGGQGGGGNGGLGATVTGTINVTPGQTLQVVVGCQGGTGANSGGYGGGGDGQSSGSGWPSYGGGGASYISTGGGMGGALVVAGGGGGQGGGDDVAAGGDAGCPNGDDGQDSFGDAGGGGTTTAGGDGGDPWTAGGGSGQDGSFGQGGDGGVDINYGNNPGGGGGGGYYGGGGGGSDNISGTSFVGGGGGGAGSSLIPAGGGCTAGGNAGAGQIAITAGCETTPPTASNPAASSYQCPGDVPAANPAVVTDEADNCTTNPVVAFVSETSSGTCPEIITRTYSVTDDCANSITVTHTITVEDTQAPVFAAPPANITVQCPGDVPAMTNLNWTDNCDGSGSVAGTDGALVGGTCGGTITRTWSYTDACGNNATANQTITINDTQAPVFAAPPANITVQCPGDVPAMTNLNWTDNCDGSGSVTGVDGALVGGTCGGTITRTWSYTDACGNNATANQTITINDTQAPVFAAPPANITVQCPGDVPAMTNLNWTDNCDGSGSVAGVDGALVGGTCGGTITRTWSYTDACGNNATANQTITINDTQAPVLAAPPANITVQCPGDVPAMTNLNWTDNCDGSGSVTGVDGALVGGTCGGTITRTWSYTDACGNAATQTQTITIDDTTDPTASNPADINQAGGTAPAPDPTVVTDEADNCTAAPLVAHISDVSDNNACPETITRTYSVTDDCGNQITVTQLIIIGDPFPPTGTAPADVTVECIADVPAADPLLITDEADNNGVPTVTHLSDVSDNNTCPETITRTYRLTDACGNITDLVQTITVDDITPPIGTAPADATVECIGDVPVVDITAITDEADNCTAAPVVAHVSDVSDNNTCPETITRTYSITDDCGNSIDVVQTITVDDITPPTGTAPADLTVECVGDVPAADPTLITDEADNCSVPTVTHLSDVSDGNTCPEVIIRTYQITDDCGNTTDVTQTITIDDTTDPTASNPADINQAGGTAPAPDPTVVTDEADNCTVNPTVAFVSDVSDGNACPETITRTYSVTDDCGNQITVTQLIIIGDPFPPTGTAPADVTVECIADVPAADPLLITDEADNNGVPTVTHLSDVSDNNTCPETITRTYRLTDACGNITDLVQIITVDDITPPTGTAPADVTVECIGDVPVVDITAITDEADNCTAAPVVVHVSDVSDGATCPETITRTYSITDDCGNVTDVVQTITVDDITPPTGTAPADITVECIGDVPVADPAAVTDEADNCTVTPTVTVADVSDGATCPETITRTYTITDDCGNTTDVVQTITVDDTTDPTASNPADINITTLDPIPAPDPTVVTDEADNCVVPTVAFVSEVSDGATCPETITRTYSVTDACGNQITVTQLVIITDPEPPTGTPPADVTVECIGDVPAADPTLITDEADNNGVPTVTHLSDVSDGNTCPEVITRTYRITDPCGNFIDVTQLITVDDITPPTGTAPADVPVECIADVPAADPALITDEADNCTAAPVVAHISDVSDGNTCPEIITRTYSITDDCGNVTTVAQTITVDDITPPTGTAPTDIIVECIGDVPIADPAAVTDEADNCTAVPTVTVTDVSNGAPCSETITRTYTITDDCGNTTDVVQTITIDDTTDPTASNPAPITVNCIDDVPAPNPAVVTDEADNCTANPTVIFVSDASDGNACNNETITRTYQIMDDCGNTAEVTQIITIEATPPTVDAGLDESICEGETVTLNATTTLNGGDVVTISWDQGVVDGVSFNPPVGINTYTATAAVCNGACFSTNQVEVVVSPNPQVAFMANNTTVCETHDIEFTNQSTNQYQCTWDFGNGITASGCATQTIAYDMSGVYDVSLTVTSDQGCTTSETYNDYIEIVPYPVAAFNYSPTELDVTDTEVNFDNQSMFADTYEWNFGDFSPNSSNTDPVHVYPDASGASYTVTLLASSNAGCYDQASAVINIKDILLFYVPNVFTPDGNSINNEFSPVFTSGVDVYDFHMTIFNRWGEVVFESYDPSVGWDGTYGQGGLVPEGVYVWQLDFGEKMSDKRHKHRGHVTVLK